MEKTNEDLIIQTNANLKVQLLSVSSQIEASLAQRKKKSINVEKNEANDYDIGKTISFLSQVDGMKKAINEMLECCTQERIDKIDGDINRIAALIESGSQDSTLGLKLNELLEEKEKIAAKELQAKHLEEVTDSFQEFLANGEIKEFTPEINRKFIEKLMVYQDKVIVHMIGGMEVEINK